MSKSIEEQWHEFRAAVFDGLQPSAVQLAETRKAFYAGAWSMLNEARYTSDLDVDAAVNQLKAWDNEGREFFERDLRNYLRKN